MSRSSPSILFGDWVPCSQSLPEDHLPVLVVSEHGKKVVMYRERGVWVEGLTTSHWEPSHWTPLPPAPNDSGEGRRSEDAAFTDRGQ